MSRPKHLASLVLGLALLLIAALPAMAQEGIPVSPTLRPSQTIMEFVISEPAAPSNHCTATSCVYLPLLYRPVPWIETGSRAASLEAYRQQYVVPTTIDPQWTGDYLTCSPGDVNPELKAAILRRVNYFRGMAGVPPWIIFNSEYNRKSQAAALMTSVSKSLWDQPPINWNCWSLAGAESFSYANVSKGGFGIDAIKGQMRSAGSTNTEVKPRRGILYPQTRQMGTGNVPAGSGNAYAAVLWVFDANLNGPRPGTRDGFVAWPPPGFVPHPVVFARWSFSYPNAYFDQATLSMTGPNGSSVPVSIAKPNYDYVENTLVWIPYGMADNADWPKPARDTIYTVTIDNVKVGLELRNFRYQVTVFDPDA